MLSAAAAIEEGVRIPSCGRALEGTLTYALGEVRACALMAGPHPFLGGDMQNNIVRAMADALARRGVVALTFNYGGVGDSEGGPEDWPEAMSAFWRDGTLPAEQDWCEDTKSAIAWLRNSCDAPLLLIGYSFGCWTVAHHLQESYAQAIVLISPNPKRHTFDALSDAPVPLLVVHSDNDFTCSVSEATAWVDALREPKTRIQLSAGDHFFRGHEEEVTQAVLGFLDDRDILRDE